MVGGAYLCGMNNAWVEKLANRLSGPLPGREAQFKMASQFRLSPDFFGHKMDSARQSAVLIALYPSQDAWNTILIKRPDYDGAHSGQVSFPGGKAEPTDPDLAFTALREANEEVGIEPHGVELIGRLTELYIPASNFMVHPFIGVLGNRPQLRADLHEVRQVLEVGLPHFFKDGIQSETDIAFKNGFKLKAPYYDVQGHVVWGATAMIISELKQVIEEAGLVGQ